MPHTRPNLVFAEYGRPGTGPAATANLPCADGRPAGYYGPEGVRLDGAFVDSDAAAAAAAASRNHVVVFDGSPLLLMPAAAGAASRSADFPPRIRGSTVLSDDPAVNPALAGYAKWLVPYCSLDFFLGSSSNKARSNNTSARSASASASASASTASSGRREEGTTSSKNGTRRSSMDEGDCRDSDDADDYDYDNRAGSLHVEEFFSQWTERVRGTSTSLPSSSAVDTLVIGGVGAGSMAVLNHLGTIREAARAVGARRVRYLLDSSLFGEVLLPVEDPRTTTTTVVDKIVGSVVDSERHPLCSMPDTEDTATSTSMTMSTATALPCCLSVHCLLRQQELQEWGGEAASASASSSSSSLLELEERFLLTDSAYDAAHVVAQLAAYDFLRGGLPIDSGISSLTGLSSYPFAIGEIGGARKERQLRTLQALSSSNRNRNRSNNVFWAMTSDITSQVIFPSIDLETTRCGTGNAARGSSSTSSTPSNYFGIDGGLSSRFQYICSATAVALQFEIFGSLELRFYQGTTTWLLSSVGGQSIRDIISGFVETGHPFNSTRPASSSSNPTIAADLPSIVDGAQSTLYQGEENMASPACPGPNCVPNGEDVGNPAENLLKIVNELGRPVPLWLTILVWLQLM